MQNAELILASTSPYRRQLLERLGVAFRCVVPEVDEAAIVALFDASSAGDLAEHLAIAKAVSVARREPAATVIGCDQVAVCDDRILGKSGLAEAAIEQLLFLSSKQHQLITAVCLSSGGGLRIFRDVSKLRMRRLTREGIERYVAADNPVDCAGSYKLESRGIALFESIETTDHTAITGLPLIALTTELRRLGFHVP